MKKMKKMMALVIAMVMVLSMSMSVFAAPDTTTEHTITVKPVAGQKGAHTYTAYKVFQGKYDSASKTLSDVDWGTGVDGTEVLKALKADTTNFQIADTSEGAAEGAKVNAFASATSAADVAKILGDNAVDNSDFAKAFSDIVGAHLGTAAGSATAAAGETATGNAVINVTGDGYYFVKDTTAIADLPDGEGRTDYILQVVNNVEITTKAGTTESEKHVDDKNDSNANDHSELKDSADYDIGDTIPYTLTAKLPADYTNYKKYYLAFFDDMSKGLTLNTDSVKIFYGANDKTGTAIQFSAVDGTSYTGGQKYSYTITDLKTGTDAQKALVAGDVITIKYTATLNSNAVIGSDGNPNKYHIEFSSNPNETGDGKPETNVTPDDINIVFTYKTVFNKVDGAGKPLTGADFTLYKKVIDESEEGFSWVDVTNLHSGEGAANPSKTKDTLTKGTDTAANAKFTFAGLDAGDYKLEETTTPVGYNTIDPIEFTITATHDLVADDPKLTSLTGNGGAEFTMTPVKSGDGEDATPTGELDADIENQSGATLPSTGGIGTTIFYIIGAILVIGAGVVLVTRRRMSAN